MTLVFRSIELLLQDILQLHKKQSPDKIRIQANFASKNRNDVNREFCETYSSFIEYLFWWTITLSSFMFFTSSLAKQNNFMPELRNGIFLE